MGYGNCCSTGYSGRRYYTRDERKQGLKEYSEALESELKAVKERIKDLDSEPE